MNYVGEILKKQRLSRRISLNKVSKELRIPKNILEKIENDKIDSSLSNVFYVGHVRSYAIFLKLNPDNIIDQFKKQNYFSQSQLNTNISKPIIQNSFSKFNRLFSFSLILFIFLSFYFLFVDVKKPNHDFANIPDIPENLEPIIEKELVNSKLKSIANNKELTNSKVSINSHASAIASSKVDEEVINEETVTLKFLNPTWLQLRNEYDKIIISQLMSKNEEYTYDLKLNYILTAGNAGNILVLINNRIKGKVGEFGEVVDSLVIDSNFNN